MDNGTFPGPSLDESDARTVATSLRIAVLKAAAADIELLPEDALSAEEIESSGLSNEIYREMERLTYEAHVWCDAAAIAIAQVALSEHSARRNDLSSDVHKVAKRRLHTHVRLVAPTLTATLPVDPGYQSFLTAFPVGGEGRAVVLRPGTVHVTLGGIVDALIEAAAVVVLATHPAMTTEGLLVAAAKLARTLSKMLPNALVIMPKLTIAQLDALSSFVATAKEFAREVSTVEILSITTGSKPLVVRKSSDVTRLCAELMTLVDLNLLRCNTPAGNMPDLNHGQILHRTLMEGSKWSVVLDPESGVFEAMDAIVRTRSPAGIRKAVNKLLP